MKRYLVTGVAGFLLASQPPAAMAQDAVVEGPGFEIGEGTVFHPSAALETGYISNVFYEDEDPVDTAIVQLIAGFALASEGDKQSPEVEAAIATEDDGTEPPPPPLVDFRLAGHAIFMGYLSDNERVTDQSDIAGAAEGNVNFLPQGDVSFSLDDQFIRDARPRNFETFGNLNRIYNHFKAGFKVQPGGRTLSVGARYENILDRFESDDSAFANRMNHIVGVRAEWRWLPITKFFLDSSLGFFGALDDSKAGDFQSDSTPLRIQAGVGTALTEFTTVRAHIGYANGFYDQRQNFQNVIGGAEFGYRYTQYGRIRLLFEYDFHDSIQANYFRDYAFMAKLDQQLGLVVLGADADTRLRGYRGIPMEIGPDSRDDVILHGALRLHYLIREQFAITARLDATSDQTDYTYAAGASADSPEYFRLEAYLGLSAAF